MIIFHVISVTRKSSLEVRTTYYKYEEGNAPKTSQKEGAEWEEVEIGLPAEEQPVIQVANIAGNVYLPQTIRLIINNPDLFGTFKIGDTIEVAPTRINSNNAN